jgi:ppGpp synthetase/RelA/SpoT-type nucleotidyltranferase
MNNMKDNIPKHIEKDINNLVKYYEENLEKVKSVCNSIFVSLNEHEELKKHCHTLKFRIKSFNSLKHKLERKYFESKIKKKIFNINEKNLFEKITDLAGIRILHLHTSQIENIIPILVSIFRENEFIIKEGPIANTWDIEYRKYYQNLGMRTKSRDSMYTSIHYVLLKNTTMKPRCEIQIRTLIEEAWGEVDHLFNYPDKIESIACQEQIKALARVTSSGTRLIDSIFRSKEEYEKFII